MIALVAKHLLSNANMAADKHSLSPGGKGI
jgi:hypothetical protein